MATKKPATKKQESTFVYVLSRVYKEGWLGWKSVSVPIAAYEDINIANLRRAENDNMYSQDHTVTGITLVPKVVKLGRPKKV